MVLNQHKKALLSVQTGKLPCLAPFLIKNISVSMYYLHLGLCSGFFVISFVLALMIGAKNNIFNGRFFASNANAIFPSEVI